MKQFFKSILIGALSTWLGFFLIFLTTSFLFIGVVNLLQGRTEPIENNSVLHLEMHGELQERTQPFDLNFLSLRPLDSSERGVGLFELIKAIKLAKEDSRIKGLYLELQDLEAGWASVEALRREILDFREAGKFVYAYGASMDENTYFLATAAEKIYLHPYGELEMNGLSVDSPFFKGALGKLGVEPRIFRVGRFKSAVEPFLLEKMSDENRLQNQMLVQDIWSVFKAGIVEDSEIEDPEIDQMADHLQIRSPAEAFRSGLVQELAYEDDVLEDVAELVGASDIYDDLHLVTPGQILQQDHSKKKSKNKIAVLFADGEISSGSGHRGTIGSDSFTEDLIDLEKDDDVKAIVLRINSPGGDALASDIMWREIMLADQTIPVIASMGDVAASGGYYIAAGARHIFAEEATLTGSIGVFGLMFGTKDLFNQKLGVTFDQVNTHPSADLGNPNRPMTDLEKEFIQQSVERTYNRFLEVVKESRGLENVDPSTYAEGRVWSGKRAKDLKLVDEIGGLDAAIRRAAEVAGLADQDYEIELRPSPRDRLEEFLNLVSGEVSQALFKDTVFSQLKTQIPKNAFRPGIYSRLPFDMKIK